MKYGQCLLFSPEILCVCVFVHVYMCLSMRVHMYVCVCTSIYPPGHSYEYNQENIAANN